MPLNLAVIGIDYIVQKTCGNEEERHHLESLGFVEGASICILSAFFGYYVVRIKDSKIKSVWTCSERWEMHSS